MLQNPENTTYHPFSFPPVFTCVVRGRMLSATIMGEYKKGDRFGYQVNFSDGYKPLFIALEETWWCEPAAESYLEAIRRELNLFIAHQVREWIVESF